MKHTAGHCIVVCILFCLSTLCLASDNPNVANPNAPSPSFRARTNPPSAGQPQRFVTRPNAPYETSGNDIVTGNVAGMKYFRGFVPYGSSYYSGAYASDRGASSVSDFLRRSAEPTIADRNPGRIASYYDPQRAVSSFQRQTGIASFAPPSLARQMSDNLVPLESLPMQTPFRPRPLSSNNQELELLLSRQAELEKAADLDAAQRQQEPYKFKSIFDQTLTPQEIQVLKDAAQKTEPQNKSKEEAKTPEQQPETADQVTADERPESAARQVLDEISSKVNRDLEAALKSINPDEGRALLGEHKTFESLAQAKFDGYIKTAETFLSQGQFYKAADTFALAAVWKPADARAYLGQAFSLFAAGEYMSSAYYLSRAIELDATTASRHYDLPAITGGRDVYESRLTELTSWQQRSGSGELAMLMAYVYWLDGKLQQAAGAIRIAADTMAESSATAVLKKLILPNESAGQP
ncbi:MAG TPA: hypothetical protein PK052_02885 [Anaerohalosphaeraceae bacterium]|nr:hypothetical protein [Phycisphaerae bacterium]HOK94646.1 hypothetical protein [Anaerohalosphaeraceae bacterium]HOL30903.1 hypothetical protein [Anaerohalosphaeraceae bacterium]HOM76031.1 hypothetical protein [Anaerohalosphaeraceae bacterium]HPC64219.1 hypothetical protein [Anaerohalosphaeraceae bacterium]